MQETLVQFLGGEDPLEKGKATYSSILAWKIPWGRKESDTTEQLSLRFSIVKSKMIYTRLMSLKRINKHLREMTIGMTESFQAANPA